MKKMLFMTILLIASLLQASCDGSGDPAFGTGSDTTEASVTNIVSAKNFFVLFSEPQLTAFDPDTGDFTSSTSDITVTAADRDNAVVEGVLVHIKADWGILSANTCITDVNGSCTVTWTTSNPGGAPRDCTQVDCTTSSTSPSYRATVVAYTTGEEAFSDANNNGTFDNGESFTDLEEPFFERGGLSPVTDGIADFPIYTSTTDPITNAPIDGIINSTGWPGDTLAHDSSDARYNGDNCTHSTLCSTTTATIIWDVGRIDLTEETQSTTEISSTGTVSRTNFTLGFSKWDLQVFDADTNSFTGQTTDIMVHAGDSEGIAVAGQVIQIRKEWGALSASSCTTDSLGNCQVIWSTSASGLAPADTMCVRIVAYTKGEEAYIETNVNDTTLDDTDAGSAAGNAGNYILGFWDMEEPYFDRNQNGSYDAGTDINIDIDGDITHDFGDGLFNGENCTATGGQCTTTTTSINIWNDSYIDLKDGTTATVPTASNLCDP